MCQACPRCLWPQPNTVPRSRPRLGRGIVAGNGRKPIELPPQLGCWIFAPPPPQAMQQFAQRWPWARLRLVSQRAAIVAATRDWMSKCPVAANPQMVPARPAASNQTNALNRGRPLGWASIRTFGMMDPVWTGGTTFLEGVGLGGRSAPVLISNLGLTA
jgi:hypothetical protein